MAIDPQTIQSTETSFAILEQMKGVESVSITELSDELGFSKSTVHRHLSTLVNLGYVQREDGNYRLGLRFLDLGEHARMQRPIHSVVRPETDDLARETGERVQVMVEEDGRGIYIYQRAGDRGITTDSHTGKVVHLHAVAAGKAYLAFLPEARVRDIVADVGLPAVTNQTITDGNTFFQQLENIRERGFAFNDEENGNGIRAVGAPIRRDDDGSIIGALSLAAPKTRLHGELYRETLPNRVRDVATVLGVKATYR